MSTGRVDLRGAADRPVDLLCAQGRQADRSRLPAREHADVVARGHVRRVWQDSGGRYGVRKVWKQLHREGVPIAKCTVRRLMRQMGLEGATRGRRWTTTTIADPAAARSPDLVERQFVADGPNRLWVSDLERHEALLNREEVEELLPWAVAAAREKLGAA